jgi:hypothetical protein
MLRSVLIWIAAMMVPLFAIVPTAWSQTSANQNPNGGVNAAPAKPSPLVPYAGTWTSAVAGRRFVTLQLAIRAGKVIGSLQHPRNVDFADNGEVKNFSDDFSAGLLQDAEITGDGLLLTVKDESTNEVDRFSMQLTGDTTATLKMLAMSMPPGMAKPKPWKLTKTGAPPSARPKPQ